MEIKESPTPSADAPETAGVADQARDAVRREVEDARARGRAGVETLRAQASDAGGALSSMVAERAERGKDEAASGLLSFAEAIRRASDDLGQRDRSMSARLVQEAAQGLERLAEGVQARSVADMARNVTAFGREHPATFLAGCLIAGVAVGRLMTASSDAADDYDSGAEEYRMGAGGHRRAPDAGQGADVPKPAGQDWGDGAGQAPGGVPGAGVMGGGAAGATGSAAGQAGVFADPVAPPSAERAPGDGGDPLGTRADADVGQPDSVLGEPEGGGALFQDPSRKEGGRHGDL
jgi:hypothetical protein